MLRNIAEVLEGPNLKPGDVKAFKFFALRVRSLVSMLEQLGSEGASELECGSRVSRLLNGCHNFKELTRDQKEAWIRKNNQCWRCGRNHHASRCTLKALCKTCNRKHLLILHDLNERAVTASTAPKPPENCLVSTTKDILYVDRSVSSRRVMLKVSKVIITNGDASLETYAVLDDGSERTILLQAAAQQLNLRGQPEDLILSKTGSAGASWGGRLLHSIICISSPQEIPHPTCLYS